MLVNLTPHDVFVHYGAGDTRRIVSAPMPARIEYTFERERGEIEGVQVRYICDTTVVNLPEPVEGTTYIVSSLVKTYCWEREDVVCPGDMVKDDTGRIIGCRSFMR